MSAKSRKRPPSVLGLLLAAALSCVLGVFWAVANLAQQSVKELSAPPTERDKLEPGEVYFIRGRTGVAPAAKSKEEAFLAGQGPLIAITESELNDWSMRTFRSIDVALGTAGNASIEAPNFRLLETREVEIHSEVQMDFLPRRSGIPLLIRGRFEATEGGPPRFVATWIRLGRSPLPFVEEVVQNAVAKALLNAMEEQPWTDAWSKVREAEVGQESIKLLMR